MSLETKIKVIIAVSVAVTAIWGYLVVANPF